MTSFKDQGNAAFRTKDYESAINFYSQAVEQTPNDHTILGNRSAAYYQLKKYDEALADADKCIEIMPDWSKGYQRKGMAMQAQGKLDEAITLYETGVDKDANNAQCKQFLDQAIQAKMQASMGAGGMPGMGGMGGMPGMGMPGMGGMGGGMGGMGGPDGPFSPANLERVKNLPKFQPYFQDVQFKNMFDMCMMNPQMLIQVMQ